MPVFSCMNSRAYETLDLLQWKAALSCLMNNLHCQNKGCHISQSDSQFLPVSIPLSVNVSSSSVALSVLFKELFACARNLKKTKYCCLKSTQVIKAARSFFPVKEIVISVYIFFICASRKKSKVIVVFFSTLLFLINIFKNTNNTLQMPVECGLAN